MPHNVIINKMFLLELSNGKYDLVYNFKNNGSRDRTGKYLHQWEVKATSMMPASTGAHSVRKRKESVKGSSKHLAGLSGF